MAMLTLLRVDEVARVKAKVVEEIGAGDAVDRMQPIRALTAEASIILGLSALSEIEPRVSIVEQII